MFVLVLPIDEGKGIVNSSYRQDTSSFMLPQLIGKLPTIYTLKLYNVYIYIYLQI